LGRQRKILCYGDSNTWGFDPRSGSRFPEEIRWPGVLGRCLGQGYWLIEDGLNGRTLCAFGMEGDPLNGCQHLPSAVEAHRPLDLAVVCLGINDLFVNPGVPLEELADELSAALRAARRIDPPIRLLVLSPLPVNADLTNPEYREQVQKSRRLPAVIRRAAARQGASFLDPSQMIAASSRDGVHIEAEQHVALGRHLCALVPEILARRPE
jgi:lysophospholipase L1-like esterase